MCCTEFTSRKEMAAGPACFTRWSRQRSLPRVRRYCSSPDTIRNRQAQADFPKISGCAKDSLMRVLRSVVALLAVTTCSQFVSAQPVNKPKLSDQVRREFLHAWTGYKKYCWGH